ncbi:hypothetical protein TMBG_02047 [Mycobacterium tuberculosis SUMu002]|nr:hypothetical protein TMBG_02047 [Mycobacterium tuberculosis SUMu002]EFP45539.1 hypothetical protein TMJG_04084 [Mycobacterium tuberculosis SUMu010]KDA14971.1 hypothetical protein CO60_1783 [Mycobacterium tuberculosis]
MVALAADALAALIDEPRFVRSPAAAVTNSGAINTNDMGELPTIFAPVQPRPIWRHL